MHGIGPSPPLRGEPLLRREVAVEEVGSLRLSTGQLVSIAVDRRVDVRVPHEHLESAHVDAAGDHQESEGVAALVQGDSLQPGLAPGLVITTSRRSRSIAWVPSSGQIRR